MWGHLVEILPSACPHSAGLLAGFCWKKVNIPAIPRMWGGRGYKLVAHCFSEGSHNENIIVRLFALILK